MPPTPLTWPTSADALTDYNVTATDAQLETAREECLRAVGLSLTTATPPSISFREGVALQALANRQSTQAAEGDEYGSQTQGVRLYPMSRAIRSKLIIPAPGGTDNERDLGIVGSMIG